MQLIKIKDQKGELILDLNNIIRIESVSNYSRIHLHNNQTILVAKILQWFEVQLGQQDFVRVHRSHIINLQYYAVVMPNGDSMFLTNGTKVPISRRRKIVVESRLRNLTEAA